MSETPLHLAARAGRKVVVRRLLEAKADADAWRRGAGRVGKGGKRMDVFPRAPAEKMGQGPWGWVGGLGGPKTSEPEEMGQEP